MIGTDYSLKALDIVEERAEKGEIPASIARKIWTATRAGCPGYRRLSGTSA
jgi:hypothetical protein